MLSLFKKVKNNFAIVLHNMRQPVNQVLIENEMRSLRAEIRSTMPSNPVLQGARIYAQCDEDGIMFEILVRVGRIVPLSDAVAEFGASDGLENMTHSLLLNGCSGYWIEGSSDKVDYISRQLGGLEFPGRLRVVRKFVSLDNADEIASDIARFSGTK
ncbi:MAG: hypothetical protein HOO99_18375, partial [Hyphomicrobiaceae bacterium]|nr:hypothetical protein [Hyphomicrobiaceae bacterium]